MRKVLVSAAIAVFIATLAFCASPRHPQKEIFNAVITDRQGNKFEVFKLSGIVTKDGPGFWCYVGNSDLKIPYKKIQSLHFVTAESVSGHPRYEVTFRLVLIDGKELKVRARDHGFQGETKMGEIKLNYRDVSNMEFKHSGNCGKCSLCLRIYYDPEWKFCPYDGEKLQRGLISHSFS